MEGMLAIRRSDDSAENLSSLAHDTVERLLNRHEIDAEVVKYMITRLLHGSREEQKRLIDHFFTDDVTFVHLLGSTKGKQNLYYVYRCATFWMCYTAIDFVKVSIEPDSAVVWLNCRVSSPLQVGSTVYPIITFLTFRKDPTGRSRVAVQLDHHSSYAFITLWGHWAHVFFSNFINPLLGLNLVILGKLADFLVTFYASFLSAFHSWLAYLSNQYKSMVRYIGLGFLAEESPLGSALDNIVATCKECLPNRK